MTVKLKISAGPLPHLFNKTEKFMHAEWFIAASG
jgi:hypothetical protein